MLLLVFFRYPDSSNFRNHCYPRLSFLFIISHHSSKSTNFHSATSNLEKVVFYDLSWTKKNTYCLSFFFCNFNPPSALFLYWIISRGFFYNRFFLSSKLLLKHWRLIKILQDKWMVQTVNNYFEMQFVIESEPYASTFEQQKLYPFVFGTCVAPVIFWKRTVNRATVTFNISFDSIHIFIV